MTTPPHLADQRQPRDGGLALSRAGGVAVVWLDRPAKLNALTREFWPGFRNVLEELAAGEACRAIIVTGSGRAFCAGGDIGSFEALESQAARRSFQADCMATFAAMEQCPLPLIAAVNGLALGGGCELAMACDLVLAAQSAVFALPESDLGLLPGYGVLRAPSIMGRQWTHWMVMTAERIDAQKAEAVGLVQKVTPDDTLLPEALDLASRLAMQPRECLSAAKLLAGKATSRERFEASIEALTHLQGTQAARDRRRAFLGRRNAGSGKKKDGIG